MFKIREHDNTVEHLRLKLLDRLGSGTRIDRVLIRPRAPTSDVIAHAAAGDVITASATIDGDALINGRRRQVQCVAAIQQVDRRNVRQGNAIKLEVIGVVRTLNPTA